MATGSVAGSYDQKSKDGNTQASNKFGKGINPSTDKGASKSQAIQKPTDKGNVK